MLVSDAPTSATADVSVRAIPGTWSVARVRRHEERAVERAVRAAGVHTYLPLLKRTRIWRDGRKTVADVPMFDEYLFVAWEYDAQRGDILSARGVLRDGLLPITRQRKFVEELAQIERVIAINPFVEVGNWLAYRVNARIASGPFQGIVGTVRERRGNRVFLVPVEELKMAAELEVEDWRLEPVN
jgi:hypothetical protein